MRISKKSISAFILSIFFVLPLVSFSYFSPLALADQDLVRGQVGLREVGSIFGGRRAEQDPRGLVVNIILIALGFLGIIFLVLTLVAGFQYMTSGGNQEKASKAMALLKNAVIGLLIVLAAWAITRFTIVMLNRAARNHDIDFYPTLTM